MAKRFFGVFSFLAIFAAASIGLSDQISDWRDSGRVGFSGHTTGGIVETTFDIVRNSGGTLVAPTSGDDCQNWFVQIRGRYGSLFDLEATDPKSCTNGTAEYLAIPDGNFALVTYGVKVGNDAFSELLVSVLKKMQIPAKLFDGRYYWRYKALTCSEWPDSQSGNPDFECIMHTDEPFTLRLGK